jgi:hypothetical protein
MKNSIKISNLALEGVENNPDEDKDNSSGVMQESSDLDLLTLNNLLLVASREEKDLENQITRMGERIIKIEKEIEELNSKIEVCGWLDFGKNVMIVVLLPNPLYLKLGYGLLCNIMWPNIVRLIVGNNKEGFENEKKQKESDCKVFQDKQRRILEQIRQSQFIQESLQNRLEVKLASTPSLFSSPSSTTLSVFSPSFIFSLSKTSRSELTENYVLNGVTSEDGKNCIH